MRFSFDGMNPQNFKDWVAKVRAQGTDLDRSAYDQLRQPDRNAPVHYYAHFESGLYTRILNRCVDPGQVCASQMMSADAKAGHAMQGMPAPTDHVDAPSSGNAAAPAQAAKTH